MNKHFKKIFSIVLALLFGTGIILLAGKGGLFTDTSVSFEKASEVWKDDLQIIPQGSPSKTLEVGRGDTQNAIATTTTDKLARTLLVDYALLQGTMSTTTLSDEDAQIFAQRLIEKIEPLQGKVYTLKNLILSSDNSDTALATYSKKVGDTMQSFGATHTTSELVIFGEALAANDAQKIEGLGVIAAQYASLTKNLLAIKTPSSVAPLHLRLVQSFSNINTAISSMQRIFTDSIQGLAGLTQYRKEIGTLEALSKEYENYSRAR